MQKTLLDEYVMHALTVAAQSAMSPASVASRAFDIAEAVMAERAKRMDHPAVSIPPMPTPPASTANISVNEAAVVEAITAMKGQKATCSMICRKAANWDGDMTALREIGQILRHRGYQKVRSGGKDYYQL